MGKAWNQGPLERGKEICSSFKSNEVIKIKSNRKPRNKSEKFSKKESSKIQGVTLQHTMRRTPQFMRNYLAKCEEINMELTQDPYDICIESSVSFPIRWVAPPP